jgi:hypothetical protein
MKVGTAIATVGIAASVAAVLIFAPMAALWAVVVVMIIVILAGPQA